MRLDIRYHTHSDYGGGVVESQNELRACPTSDERQTLVAYRLTVNPAGRVLSTVDAWGTRVDQFGLVERHDHMEIVAEAAVETRDVDMVGQVPDLAIDDPQFRDRFIDFLLPSAHTRQGPAVEAMAAELAGVGGPEDQVRALVELVGRRIEYRSGATAIGVDTQDVLEGGAGVCQDYSHVGVAVARALGVPCRYVSGYFFTSDDASGTDAATDRVEVQTHAWIEAALPGRGWLALDPTNQIPVGLRHVKIGHGRDYADVSPLRGVFGGAAPAVSQVTVQMRRMDSGRDVSAALRASTARDHHQAARSHQAQQQQQQQ